MLRGNAMAFDINTDLIKRAQQGDEEVITWLYERYHVGINCNGAAVTVNGNSNTLTLLGTCSSLTVRGNNNTITLESPTVVTNTGNENIIQ